MIKQTQLKPMRRTSCGIFEFHSIWTLLGLLIVLLALSACSATNLSSQKPKPNCNKTADPTDQDVKKALDYTGKIFQTGDWKRIYTVGNQRVAITWNHNTLDALAYLEYLVWDCGYTQPDLDNYFSQSNFKNGFFKAYDNPVEVKHCSGDNGLTLYEYSASYQSEDYSIIYWSKLESPTRILTLMLSFPTKDKAVQDQLATQLFPKLAACP
jgi:flagellar basal body-associated protein FliL